ncbi:MAG: cupin domain-containing protein [Sphingomonadales bacterium]|nr:cupin domain-containing protein [Sphingomonadales bacterium]MDE2171600.1 cupin domain-containing protein [Sphingomonadales bacterium]
MFKPSFDPAAFLRDYWQKKPVLIRNPWAHWVNPVEPGELAGLACEDGVEARLIERTEQGLTLEQGPFLESQFAALGQDPWTLLVQAVDQHVPGVGALIDPFRFVPDWRIDDVMVSYATDGGGVGPHFDQYDVFLIQGLGRRRWRVGPLCDESTPLLPHEDLRLLADFVPIDDFVLEPGDMLYIPPGYAHDGIAIGDDCMTYSVGFRAPSRGEVVEGWAAHVVDGLIEDDRYTDPDLAPQANPGEIAPEALDRLYAMALEALSDRQGFAQWLGSHATMPKYPETDWSPEQPFDAQELADELELGTPLARNPASRFAFIRIEGGVTLFVDGQAYECTGPTARLAEALCAGDAPGPVPPGPPRELLLALLNSGALAFDGDDE